MQRNRKDYIDCLMGIGILCIVIGNSIAPFNEISPLLNAIYLFIHLFHIPLLSFLFGVADGYELHNATKTILWSGLIYIVINFLMNTMDNGKDHLIQNAIIPNGIMWFLAALIIWRMTVPILAAVRRSNEHRELAFLGFLICLSLVSGYINISGTGVRMIVFYFFFALGYFCKEELDLFVMERRRAKTNRVMKFAGGAGLFLFLLIWFLQPDISLEMFAEYQSYTAGDYSLFQRLLFYIISDFCGMLLILWSARLHSPRLEKLGRNIFSVYLLHGFILILLSRIGVTDRIVNMNNRVVAVLYSIGTAILLALILSSDFISVNANRVWGLINARIHCGRAAD